MAIKQYLQIEYLSPKDLKDYHRQLRIPHKQIEKTKRIIDEEGILPTIIDAENCIIAGWHMAEAARQMRIESIPVVRYSHLTPEKVRVLRLAYDRIAEEAEWDKQALAVEFNELELLIPDLTVTAFETDEINTYRDVLSGTDPEDSMPEVEASSSITQLGDLYILGDHKLYCGDSLEEESYQTLLSAEKAQMCFTDMPFNVPIKGHVGNSGEIKHREFLMASGEMSSLGFTTFLTTAHRNIVQNCIKGAIVYSCMDWRHIREILDAALAAHLDMINLCVWAKDNGGMGSLYRSQHELVFVFKNGKEKHINNVQLGSKGRYRTNVWEYPGVNSFRGGRMDELAMHPTVKPVAMVADAIKDCSRRGGIILDPFGGSGTTLIAAEETKRKARLIELDPLYCDVIIRRWQKFTGGTAILDATGQTFDELQSARVHEQNKEAK